MRLHQESEQIYRQKQKVPDMLTEKYRSVLPSCHASRSRFTETLEPPLGNITYLQLTRQKHIV